MKRVLTHGFHITRWSFACLIIVASAFLLLARGLSEYIEDYAEDIVGQLSIVLGVPIEVDRLHAEWHGLSPSVFLDGVHFGSGETESVITSIVAKPDVISSLRSRMIVWARFEVMGTDVHLQELPFGAWSLAGIELGGGGGVYLERMMLESNQVSVTDSRFNITSLHGTKAALNVQALTLEYSLGFRRLTLDADFGEFGNNDLRFVAELTGTSSRLLDLDGLAYLKLNGEDISGLYQYAADHLLPEANLNIGANVVSSIKASSTVDAELWANFRADRQVEFQGQIVLDEFPAKILGYESGSGKATSDVFGVYSLQSQSIDVRDLRIELATGKIDIPDMRLKRTVKETEANLNLMLPSIRLSTLLDSVDDLPVLAGDGFQQVLDLNPKGKVGSFNLVIPNLNLPQWSLTAKLDSVDADSYKNAPAVRNLSGNIFLRSGSGALEIDSTDISMLYPKVYDDWVEHKSVNGLVSWEINSADGYVYAYGTDIRAHGDHGPVMSSFRVAAPLAPGHPMGADLTLYLGVQDSNVALNKKLIPESLPENLGSWLDSALVDGDVTEAAVVYRGLIRAGQGDYRTAQVRAKSENAELKFLDRWPSAKGINSEVWVSNDRVVGRAELAELGGISLSELVVESERSIEDSVQYLRVKSDAMGESNLALDLIRNTSLRDQVGGGLDGLDFEGQVSASIDLELPLKSDLVLEDLNIFVTTELSKNSLHLASQNIQIDDIEGALTFTNSDFNSAPNSAGFSAAGISAQLWGKPLEIDIKEDQQSRTLLIDAHSVVDPNDVFAWMGMDLIDQFSGSAKIDGQITFALDSITAPHQTYHFRTDMVGIASALPPPFSKSSEISAPLEIQVSAGDTLVSSVTWDVFSEEVHDVKRAPLFFELTQLIGQEKGDGAKYQSARIGAAENIGPAQVGLFSGQLNIDELDVGIWIDEFNRKRTGLASAGQSFLGLTPEIGFSVDRLNYSELSFGKVDGVLAYDSSAWGIDLRASYGTGSIQFDGGAEKLPFINITALNIDEYLAVADSQSNSQTESSSESEGVGGFDFNFISAFQFNIESVLLSGVERGHWSGRVEPSESGLWIGDLSGSYGSAILSEQDAGSSIFWGRDESGDFTELNLTFEYDNIGDLFRLMAMEPPMDSESGTFYTSLNWGGAPYDFSGQTKSGIMGFSTRNGSFYTNDSDVPNAMLKTIGLFNVGSWARRLKFDFSDVTSSGTPYDQVSGDFIIEDNLMTTLSPVAVGLSSGVMVFDGMIDLDQELVDARLVMTLPARQNLTWVAALVAGLPAAAGVWLAGKIFDEELDSLSSVSYQIQGSLDDPSIKTEKMFESTVGN